MGWFINSAVAMPSERLGGRRLGVWVTRKLVMPSLIGRQSFLLLLLLTAAAAAAVYVCCPAQTKGDIRKIASEKLQEFGIPFKAIITWPAARR